MDGNGSSQRMASKHKIVVLKLVLEIASKSRDDEIVEPIIMVEKEAHDLCPWDVVLIIDMGEVEKDLTDQLLSILGSREGDNNLFIDLILENNAVDHISLPPRHHKVHHFQSSILESLRSGFAVIVGDTLTVDVRTG